jgi:pimeloyl-ACP methyl ester carboxylesterase
MTPARRRFPIACLCLLAAALVLAPAAVAAPRKAPSGEGFYKPPARLLKGPHGGIVWARHAKNPLPQAARTWRVIYRSRSIRGKAIGVSGMVMLPHRRAPRGGWPVVSWAHGTTGIADRCAPSRDPGSPATAYIFPQVGAWLKRGYAVAFTDYEGLGTRGTHPYLIGRSEGRGVVDAVLAARRLDGRVGRRYLIAGHSQGGHAALFAAALGPSWAPGLRLRGVAAYAPASHLSVLSRALPTLTQPSPLSGLAGLVVEGLATAYPQQIDLDRLVSDKGLALLPQVHTKCVGELISNSSLGGLAPAELTRPGADLSTLEQLLDKENPNLRIRVPVLMLQGEADTTVFPFLTDQLASEYRKRGNRLTYAKYPGVDHVGIVTAADDRAEAFVRARLR